MRIAAAVLVFVASFALRPLTAQDTFTRLGQGWIGYVTEKELEGTQLRAAFKAEDDADPSQWAGTGSNMLNGMWSAIEDDGGIALICEEKQPPGVVFFGTDFLSTSGEKVRLSYRIDDGDVRRDFVKVGAFLRNQSAGWVRDKASKFVASLAGHRELVFSLSDYHGDPAGTMRIELTGLAAAREFTRCL